MLKSYKYFDIYFFVLGGGGEWGREGGSDREREGGRGGLVRDFLF